MACAKQRRAKRHCPIAQQQLLLRVFLVRRGATSHHARAHTTRHTCAPQAPHLDAVVKVYCVHTEPNYSLPWQRKRQVTSTSTGFVIAGAGRWLLTNAHSVDYATQVGVARAGGGGRQTTACTKFYAFAALALSHCHTCSLTPFSTCSLCFSSAGQGQAARRRPQVPGARAGAGRGLRRRAADGRRRRLLGGAQAAGVWAAAAPAGQRRRRRVRAGCLLALVAVLRHRRCMRCAAPQPRTPPPGARVPMLCIDHSSCWRAPARLALPCAALPACTGTQSAATPSPSLSASCLASRCDGTALRMQLCTL